MSDDNVTELALAIRRHPETRFTGEDSPDEIIRTVLNQYVAGLNEEEQLSEEAAAEQNRLRRLMGLSDETATEELAETEELDEVARKQAELRERFMRRARRGRR